LTGDYMGAIEDFTFFVAWSQENNRPEQERAQREVWITALQAGINPFDQTTLDALIEQGASPAANNTPTPTPAVTSTPWSK
jgi:hypothetical protein